MAAGSFDSVQAARATLNCTAPDQPNPTNQGQQPDDEVAGRFAGQELVHMLRRCGKERLVVRGYLWWQGVTRLEAQC